MKTAGKATFWGMLVTLTTVEGHDANNPYRLGYVMPAKLITDVLLQDGVYLYRAMKPAADGLPEIPIPGTTVVSRQLGARDRDIAPLLGDDGKVRPKLGSKGGLSTSTASAGAARPTFADPIEAKLSKPVDQGGG